MLRNLIQDISNLLKLFSWISFDYVFRAFNIAAHELAKFSLII